MKKSVFTALALLLALTACSQQQTAAPPPQAITDASKGYYCTMNLAEHNGPKAQVFHQSDPGKAVWFSTVRQMLGYLKHPGEPRDILAIYVTDMSKVKDWNVPNADNDWIDAKTAYYVIDSKFIGGMGFADALPFSDQTAAQAYVKQNGGRVLRMEEIPDSYIYQ